MKIINLHRFLLLSLVISFLVVVSTIPQTKAFEDFSISSDGSTKTISNPSICNSLFTNYGFVDVLTTQPAGVTLNPNGTSTTGGVFNTTGWSITRGPGMGDHRGDDYYADDLARACGQTAGENLYAGISGVVDLNPDMDGHNDYYGNTVVIYDETTHFALRYAHMQEFNPALQNGAQICAGQYLGKVGNTGNTASTTCTMSPGAHLHMVLYKNVTSLNSRPIRGSIVFTGNPTMYAAPFVYNATQVINVPNCGSGNCTIPIGQGTGGSEFNAFQNAYNTGGGQSALGCATANVRFDGFTSFAGTVSHYQTTTGGDIEYHTNGSRAGQAFAILTPFLNKWASFGYTSNNPMGYPIGFTSLPANSCYGTQNRYQSFEGGSLSQHLTGSMPIYEVHGAIHRKWEQMGFAICPLGLPTSDETTAQPSGASGSTGKLNQFQGGQIYWKTGAPNAYEVHGSIYQTYVHPSLGGSAGWLGFPTSDEFISNGYARSNFEGGYITTLNGSTYQAFPYTTCAGNASANPSSGYVGSTITITGQNFNGVNSVRFSNNVSAQFNINSESQITATVPPGAVSGVITLSEGGCGNAQTQSFTVLTGPVNPTRRQFDFDGDGKADVSVYRPSNGIWHISNSLSGYSTYGFGVSSDIIVPADYDGDGKTDYAVYRPSNGVWYLQRSSLGFSASYFGLSTDIPMPADYDGDGKADIAVYRPSNGRWYLNRSSLGYTEVQFGTSEDRPVSSDYDGDSKADIAVYRPSNGIWYISQTSLGYRTTQFGVGGDRQVPADYDGDLKTDVAVYRPSNGRWYILRSSLGYQEVQFGISEDKPVAADYDGDGKADVAVYRPSNGVWYLQRSNLGYTAYPFGISSDAPIPFAYVR